MYLNVLKPLDNVQLRATSKSGDRTIFSHKIDICDQFTQSTSFWWKSAYERASKLGKLPRPRCPIPVDLYTMKNISALDMRKMYPTILPKFEMQLIFDLYIKKDRKSIHITRMTFTIKTVLEKGSKKQSKL